MQHTLHDYVWFRKDLSMVDYPYTIVDYLVFTAFSYVAFDGLKLDSMSLYDAFQLLHEHERIDTKRNAYDALLADAMQGKRYQNIRIVQCASELNEEKTKQFAAITLQLEDESLFVSFRGTDDTMIGWKEDFLMLCQSVVEAQQSAVHYVEASTQIPYTKTLFQALRNKALGSTIWERLKKHRQLKKQRPILLGGHSKGGNLAMFAGCFIAPSMRKQIQAIYNFDGPGFQEDMIYTKEYQTMRPYIHSYIPGFSFFGRILTHQENCFILHSYQERMLQHDLFSWEVTIDGFVEDTLSEDVLQFSNKVDAFVDKLSLEERRIFVETLFQLFESLGFHTMSDLMNMNYKHVLLSLNTILRLSPQTRSTLIEGIQIIGSEFTKIKVNG